MNKKSWVIDSANRCMNPRCVRLSDWLELSENISASADLNLGLFETLNFESVIQNLSH